MISFTDATDDELRVMCDAIDALMHARPALLHEDETGSLLVHAVLNEIIARRNIQLLAAERAA